MGILVHEFVHAAVRRFANHIALVDNQRTQSYAEVWERSSRLAAAFTSLGVAPGDRIVALMDNRNEWVEVDNATSMIGAVRGRLNAHDSARKFASVLSDLRPKAIVAGPEFIDPLGRLISEGKVPPCELLELGPGGNYEHAIAEATPAQPLRFDDTRPYLIFHSSGTTGPYKGAVYSHSSWVNTYRNILALLMDNIDTSCSFLHVEPLSHQSGILTAPSLFRGARSIMMKQFTPEAFFDAVERHRVTHTILAPAIIDALAHHPHAAQRDLSSLRRIYYSGAPIAPTVLSRAIDVFGPIFLQGYGSTEGGTVYNTILYPDEHVNALKYNPKRLASCGRPVPFFDVKLADEVGRPVTSSEMGEVWVRGDAVSGYYWNQPEASAEAYVGGWFRTGDLAVQDDDGFVTIIDQKNEVIISGGLNVYPHEVEDIIAAHPAVEEVAVIGVPDDKCGEAVKACVSLHPGTTLTLNDLQQHCKESGLTSYKNPLSLDLVDEIPKTAVGNVFRRKLREPYWIGSSRRVG